MVIENFEPGSASVNQAAWRSNIETNIVLLLLLTRLHFMARWFWYLSSKKIGSLKKPARGWGILRQRLRTADLEAGVPWAKISARATPEINAIESVEGIEREIYRDHAVPSASEIKHHGDTPLFFRFEGFAGRLILRESYNGEEGECVFLMVGVQGSAGVLLLGAGSHVYGSTSASPRFVDPSIDPVGALLVLMDRQAQQNRGSLEYTRAGISSDSWRLSPQECVSYSFGATLDEVYASSFMYRARALAIASVVTQFYPAHLPQVWDNHSIDRVIVGSPIYVEQIGSQLE